MKSELQLAQAELSAEIEKEAAKIVREQGIGMYDALIIARKRVQERRASIGLGFKGWAKR